MPLPKFVSALLLLTVAAMPVSGQSRRQNPPPSAPPVQKPTQKPTPPVTIRGIRDQAQSGPYTRTLLDNGLTVLFSEDHAKSLVSIAVRVGAGTADEPETARGASWATAWTAASVLSNAFAATGASLRVEVGPTETLFVASSTVKDFPKTFEALAEAVARPALTPENVKAGIERAVRDRATLAGDAEATSRLRWYAAAFPAHPLGRDLPTAEQLAALAPDAVKQFHAARFVPRATVLSIAGDVNPVTFTKPVADRLGTWSGGANALPAAPADQKTILYKEERGPTGGTWVNLSYRLGKTTADERVALEVLRGVLAVGRGARLPQALREARGIASDVIADAGGDVPAFRIALRVLPESLDRAEALTIEAVERLRRERISDGELQRAKSVLILERLRVEQRTGDLAVAFARADAARGFQAWADFEKNVEAVTAEQIRAAAARFLIATRMTVHEYQSPSAPPRTFTPEKFAETVGILVPATLQTDIPESAVTDGKDTKTVAQGKPRNRQTEAGKFIILGQAEPVRDFSTLRGPRAYVRVDNTLPLLTVGFYFQGGRFVEDESNAGITELMLRAMLRGTAKYPNDALLAEIEQLGGDITVVSELDYFGLELTIRSRNAELGMERMFDLLENPTFDAAIVKRERDRLLAEQTARYNTGRELAPILARRSLFPLHPYGFPPLGVNATVSKLSDDDVKKWHAGTVLRQMPLVAIVGDTDGSALVSKLVDAFTRNDIDKSLKARVAAPATPPAEQNSVAGASDIVALTFAGPAGRETTPDWEIFSEILDARLANASGGAFRATLTPHLQRTELLLVGEGAPGEAPKLASTLQMLIKNLSPTGVTDEEWQAARRRTALRSARTVESFEGRTRAYVTAIYIGVTAQSVETRMDDLLRANRENLKDVLDTLRQYDPGQGVVKAGRK